MVWVLMSGRCVLSEYKEAGLDFKFNRIGRYNSLNSEKTSSHVRLWNSPEQSADWALLTHLYTQPRQAFFSQLWLCVCAAR